MTTNAGIYEPCQAIVILDVLETNVTDGRVLLAAEAVEQLGELMQRDDIPNPFPKERAAKAKPAAKSRAPKAKSKLVKSLIPRSKLRKKTKKPAKAQPVVTEADCRRGEVGRKNIGRLFREIAEADWLTFADNPLFDRETGMCRAPELADTSLTDVMKLVPLCFSSRFAGIRAPALYSSTVHKELTAILKEITESQGRVKLRKLLKEVKERTPLGSEESAALFG